MGDFERTFGAGADIDGIIDDFNRSFRDEQQTHEDTDALRPKHFGSFQEASAWAKSNPGKSIKNSPIGDGYIEVLKATSHPPTNTNRDFLISIKPGDIEVEETHAASFASLRIEEILANPNSKMDEVISYISSICSIGGVTDYVSLSRTPPSVAQMSKSIIAAGWQLYPISDAICLIDSVSDFGGSIDGALVTVNGCTQLISSGKFSEKIYKALMES